MLIDLNNEIDETEYAKLERVQCHKERIRRRESLVPTVLSIVEDPFLELLCEDTGQEPDHARVDSRVKMDQFLFWKKIVKKVRYFRTSHVF